MGILPIYLGSKLLRSTRFWYLTGRGDAAGIGGLPNNVGQWKNDLFFYPSAHYGEFRIGRK